MLNAPSFSEDMLPRHFPKINGQSEQKSAAAPMPTLPGLSLLLDDDNNKVVKTEPMRKIEPKKSFEQWKQQHHAIFIENSVPQQRKSDKKHVRFESDSVNPQPVNRQLPSPVSPNLELSYHEHSPGEHFCQNQGQKDYHQHYGRETEQCDDYGKNVPLPSCIHNRTSPSCASQTTVQLPHFNRPVRSESMKENNWLAGANLTVHKDTPRQCNGTCCQANLNNWEMMNYQTCNHGIQPNGCANKREIHHPHQHNMQPKTISSPFAGHVDPNFKEQLTDDTLLSIMEEQQKHILVQQSQIMMQQKQNMIQQKQIFMLQHQVQQLLLRNGTNTIESPNKLCQTSSICDKPATQTTPKALPNQVKTPRSGKVDPMQRNGATTKSSIGVMTSFLGNVTDGMPSGMHQFNERFTTKLANEKFIENMGGEHSYKDSMLDRINDAIKNSSAMVDYRNNGTADDSTSPNRQSDMNIATQALFYESSSTNNGCTTNDQKTTDRSFALYMLGMKYDCAQDDASKNIDKRDWQSQKHSIGKSDQVSVNLSPEVYDYLKRHGLLKQD